MSMKDKGQTNKGELLGGSKAKDSCQEWIMQMQMWWVIAGHYADLRADEAW